MLSDKAREAVDTIFKFLIWPNWESSPVYQLHRRTF